MNKTIIIKKIAEISETDVANVTESTELAALECWDSLAQVTFVAFAVSEFGVKVTADEIMNALTVGDLIELIESKRQ